MKNYQQVLDSPSSIFRGMFWGYRQTAQFHGPFWIYTQTIQWDRQNNLALLFHGNTHPSPACSCTVWLTYKLRNLFSSALTNRSHGSREWLPLTFFLRTTPRQVPQGGGTFNRESCVFDLRAELRPSSVFYMPFSLGGETTVWLPALSPIAPSYPTDIFAFH